jgi:hypothetical protein
MDKPRPLTELFKRADFPAEGVLQRGQFLHRLNRLVSRLLDDDSKLHCQVGNLRDGILILYADTTAWASRLRYQGPALLKQLQQRKGLESLQQVEIRVMPREEKVSKEHKAELSEEASSCLSACADSIEDDALRNALQSLAAHHKRGR